jgi:GTP pyrophosphokinase
MHKEQRRKSGEAYIFHPIAVAKIVASEIGLGATSIAALMHDVVEDTSITVKDIEKMFNPKVAQLVEGLTKISLVQRT